ncbi:META domain-containing protein [Streptomyces nodosus]|uniref:META domain-containing protein n=1 Tax=Streptomyces nodosus TaxID=40318 RepID=UPI003456E45D
MNRHPAALLALTLTLVLLPLAVACGTEARSGKSRSTGPDGDPPVIGVHWRVDSLTTDGTTRNAPAGAYLRIDDHGRISGNYGCNSFRAPVTVRGDRIVLGPADSTAMACVEGSDFERDLSRTLDDGTLTAEVHRDRLTLTAEDGTRVDLTEEKDASLYGTAWRVTSLVDGDTATSVPGAAADRPWFTLDRTAGTVSGGLGCHRFGADATVRDGRLTTRDLKVTGKMCDDSLRAVEKTLIELLGRPLSYRIDHRNIVLTSENGKGVQAVAEP